ncbi:hypothetical protein CAPTEDRAFT_92810, partial [Capitella teleta]
YSFETSNPLTWQEAKQACLGKGGRLVVIETDEEFDFIAEILRGNTAYRRNFWTGANDLAEDGNWIWDGSDHQVENFNRWGPVEPNGGTMENCGNLYRHINFALNDSPCSVMDDYICEYNFL